MVCNAAVAQTEGTVSYPIKTLGQLPLVIKGFRKEKQLTQATMGEKLGITQQSYAAFEANPAMATLGRLFLVLRLLDVEISLDQVIRVSSTAVGPPARDAIAAPPKADGQKGRKDLSALVTQKKKPATAKPSPIVAPTRKKESW